MLTWMSNLFCLNVLLPQSLNDAPAITFLVCCLLLCWSLTGYIVLHFGGGACCFPKNIAITDVGCHLVNAVHPSVSWIWQQMLLCGCFVTFLCFSGGVPKNIVINAVGCHLDNAVIQSVLMLWCLIMFGSHVLAELSSSAALFWFFLGPPAVSCPRQTSPPSIGPGGSRFQQIQICPGGSI